MDPAPGSAGDDPRLPYVAPTVTYLGTLAALTRGGSFGPADGVGVGAGTYGSV